MDIKNVSALGIGGSNDVRTLRLDGSDEHLRPYDSRVRVRKKHRDAFAAVFDQTPTSHGGGTGKRGATITGESATTAEHWRWLNDSKALIVGHGGDALFGNSDASIDLDELLLDPEYYLAAQPGLFDPVNVRGHAAAEAPAAEVAPTATATATATAPDGTAAPRTTTAGTTTVASSFLEVFARSLLDSQSTCLLYTSPSPRDRG